MFVGGTPGSCCCGDQCCKLWLTSYVLHRQVNNVLSMISSSFGKNIVLLVKLSSLVSHVHSRVV